MMVFSLIMQGYIKAYKGKSHNNEDINVCAK